MQLQKMSKLLQLAVEILIDSIKALLQLLVGEFTHRVVRRVVVDVGQKYRLRECWLDMFSRAAIPVTASSNLG